MNRAMGAQGLRFALLLVAHYVCVALDNGLGLTPPMGWNSWNHFRCHVSDALIRKTADAFVSTGLAKAGYKYVNIDDCWHDIERDSDGNLAANPDSFPDGIRNLSDYVHSKGLLFGMYTDSGAGEVAELPRCPPCLPWLSSRPVGRCSSPSSSQLSTETCAGYPGSLDHEYQDAQRFADWGVDYLKVDNCFSPPLPSTPQARYKKMSDAILATGRPTFFSLCEWGLFWPSEWASQLGNSWRTTADITLSWESIMNIADDNEPWWRAAGPGGWNDPDMLEVGNGKLTEDEERAHFSLWALMKAPLLIGCDVRHIPRRSFEILTNPEVIAINQDPLGVQGHRVWSSQSFMHARTAIDWAARVASRNLPWRPPVPLKRDGQEVWAGRLADGAVAVLLLNRGEKPADITAKWADLGLSPGNSMSARDVWRRADLGTFIGSFTAPAIPPHGVVMLRLTPVVGEAGAAKGQGLSSRSGVNAPRAAGAVETGRGQTTVPGGGTII